MTTPVFLHDPPPPEQRIVRLYVWVCIHPGGGEGVMSADLPLPAELGSRHMPLMSSKRATAERLAPLARQVAAMVGGTARLVVFAAAGEGEG